MLSLQSRTEAGQPLPEALDASHALIRCFASRHLGEQSEPRENGGAMGAARRGGTPVQRNYRCLKRTRRHKSSQLAECNRGIFFSIETSGDEAKMTLHSRSYLVGWVHKIFPIAMVQRDETLIRCWYRGQFGRISNHTISLDEPLYQCRRSLSS